MTKEELEKATGQELIEQRDYCGVDGYYGDCLNDVNAEMLKRFNRLVEFEKENAELKEQIADLKNYCCEVSKYLHDNSVARPDASAYKKRDALLIKEFKLCEKWGDLK